VHFISQKEKCFNPPEIIEKAAIYLQLFIFILELIYE
jgi:hypothetical protein